MKIKYLSLYTAMVLLTALLSSCLKSEPTFTDFSKVGTLVELPLAAYTGMGKLTIEALPIKTTPQSIPVVVNVAAPNALGSPLTVTLALGNQAAVDSYNSANGFTSGAGTAYILPPSGSYSLSSTTVVVPANQHTATVNLLVNTSVLDPSALYLIPVSIIDASGQQISNYKTILFSVQPKNSYDGIYSMNGYTLRAGDPVLTGNFTMVSQTLATAGSSSVVGLTQVWRDGSGVGGISPVTLTVNPATNKVAVSSNVNATLVGDATYDNRYDPTTKTFYVSFYWNAGKTSRAATDTLTYVGPRP